MGLINININIILDVLYCIKEITVTTTTSRWDYLDNEGNFSWLQNVTEWLLWPS